MVRKGMWVSVCVAGILSLAGLACAGDMMIWSPRTPAGGGSPGFIGSYLSQAAAVEYGAAGTVGRDIVDRPETHQKNYYETESTQKYYTYDELNDALILYQQNVQTTVQKQESVIYYPKN